jgi:trans-2,3-dihydro-3-hydroxyanthranilate isomerase
MSEVRVTWLDVFVTAPLTGNPLAVVWGADGWEASQMQALAGELNLSETVFVLDPADAAADARLRIFTPARELPMAGHPVVGAAWALRDAGRMGPRGAVETGVGTLAVRAEGDRAWMVQARPERGPGVDAAEAAAACGTVAAAWPPAEVWSTGLAQLMVPVPGLDALAAARPDAGAITALGARDGWAAVSLFALLERRDGAALARVRHFAPALGVLEDPVTGSAAGALGARLAAADPGAGDALALTVLQGEELGRPGRVEVRVRLEGGAPAEVEVGGAVAAVLEARLLADPPRGPDSASP